MSLEKFKPAAKFWVGLVGAVASGLALAFVPNSTAGHVLAAIAATAGVVGVYLVPNKPA